MKKLFATAVLVMLATPALAQSVSGSNSNSGAAATSINNFQGGKSYRGTGGAFAPGLAASGLSCLGSASGGVGGSGFSIAFGTTKMDKDCNTRENAKLAGLIAGKNVAKEVACNIPEIEEAMEVNGVPCYAKRAKRANSWANKKTLFGNTVQTKAAPQRVAGKVQTFSSMKVCRAYVKETGANLVCRKR